MSTSRLALAVTDRHQSTYKVFNLQINPRTFYLICNSYLQFFFCCSLIKNTFLTCLKIKTHIPRMGKYKKLLLRPHSACLFCLPLHQKPSGCCFEIDGLWIKLSEGISVIRKTLILSRSNGQVLTTNSCS